MDLPDFEEMDGGSTRTQPHSSDMSLIATPESSSDDGHPTETPKEFVADGGSAGCQGDVPPVEFVGGQPEKQPREERNQRGHQHTSDQRGHQHTSEEIAEVEFVQETERNRREPFFQRARESQYESSNEGHQEPAVVGIVIGNALGEAHRVNQPGVAEVQHETIGERKTLRIAVSAACVLLPLIAGIMYGEFEKANDIAFLFDIPSVRWALIASGAQLLDALVIVIQIRRPVSRMVLVMRGAMLILAFMLALTSVLFMSNLYFSAEDISPLRDGEAATIPRYWRKMVSASPARVCKFQRQHQCTGFEMPCSIEPSDCPVECEYLQFAASQCGGAVTAQVKGDVLPFLVLQILQVGVLVFDIVCLLALLIGLPRWL